MRKLMVLLVKYSILITFKWNLLNQLEKKTKFEAYLIELDEKYKKMAEEQKNKKKE